MNNYINITFMLIHRTKKLHVSSDISYFHLSRVDPDQAALVNMHARMHAHIFKQRNTHET